MARKKVLLLKVILLLAVICENQANRLPDNTQYAGVPDVHYNAPTVITHKDDNYIENNPYIRDDNRGIQHGNNPGLGSGKSSEVEDTEGGNDSGQGNYESPEANDDTSTDGSTYSSTDSSTYSSTDSSTDISTDTSTTDSTTIDSTNTDSTTTDSTTADTNTIYTTTTDDITTDDTTTDDTTTDDTTTDDTTTDDTTTDDTTTDVTTTEKELEESAPTIEIGDLEPLSGIIIHDRLHSPIYAYLRIPYAQPPVGPLRFEDPVPAEGWGERNPYDDLPFCVQYDREDTIIGQEDCLYLNVYVPAGMIDSETPKAVMVFLHGDNFDKGSGSRNQFDPRFLLTEDVILVTINYRLGIFGFFNFHDEEVGISGNAGLKDQLMALKWVKDHISYFGGDSDNVCLFGQGAGAASVHFHILSPRSAGLFHRAILQSGTALSPWAMGSQDNGIKLAMKLGFATTNPQLMLNNLRRRTEVHIITAARTLANETRNSYSPWSSFAGPIIETSDEKESFLTDHPLNIIESGEYNKVPLIIGFTDSEGIGVEQILRSRDEWEGDIENFFYFIPTDLPILKDSGAANEITQRLRAFYTKDDDGTIGLVPLFTDIFYGFPAFRTALKHAETSDEDVFFYKFSANTNLNVFKIRDAPQDGTTGASHGDDLGYLFYTPLTPATLDSNEVAAMERVVRTWTTFAKSGKPSFEQGTTDGTTEGTTEAPTEEPAEPPAEEPPADVQSQSDTRSVSLTDSETWLPFTVDYAHYANIQTEYTQPSTDPNSENMELWVNIYRDFADGSAAVHAISLVLTVCIVALHIIVNQY